MKAAVIGLGTMGPGIAAVLARGGMEVACYDLSPEQLKKAEGELSGLQQVLDRIRPASRSGKVSFDEDLGRAAGDADLVVEAVPEKLELKRKVFAEIECVARPDAILASNTSGIPITRLQEAVTRKGRLVGMHWSNPPHVIPMVELIAGAHTERAVLERIREIAEACGLIPVIVDKDVPGFVHNRLLYAILREAVSLV